MRPNNNDKVTNKIVKENYLDFLYELHTKGTDIGDANIDLLKRNGYIKEEEVTKEKKDALVDIIAEETLLHSTEKNKEADSNIDIIFGNGYDDEKFQIITDKELLERSREGGIIFIGRKEPITQKDWRPESVTEHTKEFIEWINSINNLGLHNKTQYEKFVLYCQQAYTWLQEKSSVTDFYDQDDKEEYMMQELDRCAENSLYFLNKYVYYKEGDDEGGKTKYIARPAHEILSYLNDCGYSIGLVKGRQMAATTTLMALDVKDVIFKKNYFMKFITEDKEKAEEIFEDKLKFAFSELPWWMKPNVLNERDNLFKLGSKPEKGTKEGVGSKIAVVAPKRTAIAGGAPQKVKIDEAGNIGLLGKMIDNARPTMLKSNPVTKKIEIKRQLLFWGCVCAGTKVWTNDGRLVNIENLKQEDGILGYNEKGISKENILWMKPPAKKPCYRIETTGGDFIECSEDHPLLSVLKKTSYNKRVVGFKRADEIKKGDHLMFIGKVDVFGNKKIEHARLMGLMIGDGCYSLNATPQVSVSDRGIEDYIMSKYNQGEFTAKIYKIKSQKDGGVHNSIGVKGFVHILREFGIHGQTKENKRLPENINEFDKQSLSELIAGYYDADGSVRFDKNGETRSILLTSSVKELLLQVKFQLTKFGISSNLVKENRGKDEAKISSGQKNYIYRLYINNFKDLIRFKENFKLLSKHKQDAINRTEHSSVTRVQGETDNALFQMRENGKGKYFMDKEKLSGMKYKLVKKVEYIGEKDIYNLTAGVTHTYIANGFITANTGGELEKGGKSFETEFMSLMKQWNEADYSSCIIPLFFNWQARPFATKEDYENEKRVAYSKVVSEQEKDAVIEFHQSWPETLADVFRTNAKTLVPEDFIKQNIDRIREDAKKAGVTISKKGYFEPIYDTNQPEKEGSDVPYRIIGAEFIPTEDFDPRASVEIFMEPKKGWINRYFQGTDPIDTDTGLSNMASAIWDKYFKTIAAILDWRTRDPKEVFLQTMLLGLYYDTSDKKEGVLELVESNRGTSYTQYKEAKGFGNKMVLNYQLPPYFQNNTTINEGVGIDNKGVRNTMIINRIHELTTAYGDRIYVLKYWDQLSSFTCSISDRGKEMWGPMNKKYFKDDVLFGAVFSYICAELTFTELNPSDMNNESKKLVIKHELVRDANWNLIRVPVKKRV